MARLLVVDDDPEILKLVADVGKQLSYDVEVVHDADSFIRAFTRDKPDIVFLDIVMPGMDGIELVRWMADRGAPDRIVIASGAQGGQYGRFAASLARAHDLLDVKTLPKPFRLAALRDVLR